MADGTAVSADNAAALGASFGAAVAGEDGARFAATMPAGAMSGSRISPEEKLAIQRGLQDLLLQGLLAAALVRDRAEFDKVLALLLGDTLQSRFALLSKQISGEAKDLRKKRKSNVLEIGHLLQHERARCVSRSINCAASAPLPLPLPLMDALVSEPDTGARKLLMMEHMAEEILTQKALDLRLADNVVNLFLHWDRCDSCSGRRGFHHAACMYQHGSISRAETSRQEWILLACFFSRGSEKLEISTSFAKKYVHYQGLWEARLQGSARAKRTASKLLHRRNRQQADETNHQARAEAESRAYIEELRRIFSTV